MNSNPKGLRKHNLLQLTLTFGVLFLGGVFGSSAKPAKPIYTSPIKFDVYNNLCWEDETARLDNFIIQLKKTPKLVGEIIVYAGKQSCEGEAEYRGERAKKWILKRGIKKEQLRVHDGGYREVVETEIWMHPGEAAGLWFQTELTKEQVSIRKRCIDKVFERVICLSR